MTTAVQSVSVKSLAFRVLREMAARREVRGVCPTPVDPVGQGAGQETSTVEAQTGGLAPCGSPQCAACYVVDAETGAKIHPPKCGQKHLDWLKRWEPKGRTQ